jgi:hypothetical protein
MKLKLKRNRKSRDHSDGGRVRLITDNWASIGNLLAEGMIE